MRRNFARLAAVSLLALGVQNLPSQAQILSVRDALSFVYSYNPQLEAARARLRATDQGISRANAGWKPAIALTGSAGIQDRRTSPAGAGLNGGVQPLNGQISIVEPLYRGGRTMADIKQAKARILAGRAELTRTEGEVLLAALTSYMDVVRDRAILEFRRQNISLLSRQLSAVQEMNRLRAATLTDVNLSEARLARSRGDLSVAQAQLAASLSRFEQSIGRAAETLEVAHAPPAADNAQPPIEAVIDTHPLVIAARENERAAEHAVEGARGALLPEVSLQMQYQQSRDDLTSFNIRNNQSAVTVMLQARIPLFQGGAEYAAVREARELKNQQHFVALGAEAQVRQAVAQSRGNLEAARMTLASTQAQVTASAAALDGISEGQRGGERSILDVLNATQELVEAQVASAVAARNNVVAAYQVLEALGQLSAVRLNLPVTRYDPEISYQRARDAWIDTGD